MLWHIATEKRYRKKSLCSFFRNTTIKRGKVKGINTYERTLQKKYMALGYPCLLARFYFLHLLFIRPVYLPLTSCHSPQVFCPFKKYIELFTQLHAWYCCCQSTSLWKKIREKFLGHVCETCQRILISADKDFSLLFMDMKSYEDFFFFLLRCELFC